MKPTIPANPSQIDPADILHWLTDFYHSDKTCLKEAIVHLREFKNSATDYEFEMEVSSLISRLFNNQPPIQFFYPVRAYLRTFLDKPLYLSGDGSSEKNAVRINATSTPLLPRAEWAYLNGVLGKEGDAWRLVNRWQKPGENGVYQVECFEVVLADGAPMSIWFDVSIYFEAVVGVKPNQIPSEQSDQ